MKSTPHGDFNAGSTKEKENAPREKKTILNEENFGNYRKTCKRTGRKMKITSIRLLKPKTSFMKSTPHCRMERKRQTILVSSLATKNTAKPV